MSAWDRFGRLVAGIATDHVHFGKSADRRVAGPVILRCHSGLARMVPWVAAGQVVPFWLERFDPQPLPGEVLASWIIGGERFDAFSLAEGALHCSTDPVALAQLILDEQYCRERQSWLSRLPVHPHHLLPTGLRRPLGELLTRLARNAGDMFFPAGPAAGPVDLLRELVARTAPDNAAPTATWPSGASCALILTHDVENTAAFADLERMQSIEREFGFRSAAAVVTHLYRIDHSALARMAAGEGEVIAHDSRHDHRLPALAEPELRARLAASREALAAYATTGFRSPGFFRNQTLRRLVAEQYTHDLSTYDSNRYSLTAFASGMLGVGSVFPFAGPGGLVEIPTTLLFDEPLADFRDRLDALLALHLHTAETIRARGGVICVQTHPCAIRREPKLLPMYRAFLTYCARELRPWNCLPREMAAWFRGDDGDGR